MVKPWLNLLSSPHFFFFDQTNAKNSSILSSPPSSLTHLFLFFSLQKFWLSILICCFSKSQCSFSPLLKQISPINAAHSAVSNSPAHQFCLTVACPSCYGGVSRVVSLISQCCGPGLQRDENLPAPPFWRNEGERGGRHTHTHTQPPQNTEGREPNVPDLGLGFDHLRLIWSSYRLARWYRLPCRFTNEAIYFVKKNVN